MTVRRVLVGLVLLAVLSALLVGVLGSSDDSAIESIAPSAEATPDAAPSVEPSAAPQPEIRDADLQDGLVALCSNDAQESTDNESSSEDEEAYRTVVERLAASSSAEHVLAAALQQRDSAAQIDLIKRAVSASPNDPLVLWSAVRICSDPRDPPDCPLREWEQRLIAVDGQNSESWMQVATNRYAAGEDGAALEAMRFASTAAESSIFWTETIELIERGLLAAGDFTFEERAIGAIGVAAGELPSYNGLTTMCRAQSAVSPEWADVCLRYGELVEDRGTTVISVMIAQAVQRGVLEAVGDSARLAELQARIEASSQEVANVTSGFHVAAMELAAQNPNLFYSYLAAIRSEGETAAIRRVTTEVERLVRQRPELACQ